MKKFKFSAFCLSMLFLLVLGGCSGNDDEVTPPGEGPSSEVTIEIESEKGDEGSAIYATSATISLNLKGVETYTYQVEEGSVSESDFPDGEIMFANAEKENGNGIFTAQDGKNTAYLYGLNGNTKYTAIFAFKVGTEYQVKGFEFTTPEYSRRITIISATRDEIKFHIEMPEGVYYKWSFTDALNYNSMKDQFMQTDVDFLRNPSVGVSCGPQDITITSGVQVDPDDPMWGEWQVTQGTAYVILVGESDEEGNLDYEVDYGGGMLMSQALAPTVGDYTEEWSDEGVTFNGMYAKQMVYAQSADRVDEKATVTVLKKNETKLKVAITPPTGALSYGVYMTSEDDYELMKKYVGEQGVPALVFNESTPLVEPQEIEYTGMSIGKKYHLFITCNFADDYSKQSFQEEVYEIVESTKPDVELTVAGNVEPDQPYKVSYTIKAPNGDCRGIRYVENSMSEWNASLRPEYGMDEKYYVTNYGLDVTDADVITAINSSEGYKMYFDSFPEEENMLVVQAYNEDEDLSEPYMAKATAVADFGTPVDAGGQSVLDALCGTWNATFNRQGSNGETETVTFPIEFSREPEEAGEYADYDKLVKTIMTMKNMTEEEAKLYIEEEKANYIQAREKQIELYKMKNRVVGRFKGDFPHKYASPWDLFNNISYSAVDADDLFFDYGPKIFFEVIPVEDNGQTLYAVILSASNIYSVPPLSAWNTPFVYYVAGYDSAAGKVYYSDFNVQVVDDNNLAVKVLDYNGMNLLPSFIGTYNNNVYSTYYGTGDMTLSRSDASSRARTLQSSVAPLKSVAKKSVLTTPWAAYQTATIKNMPKTFLPSADVARKLKRESVTIDCSKSSFIKKIQK